MTNFEARLPPPQINDRKKARFGCFESFITDFGGKGD